MRSLPPVASRNELLRCFVPSSDFNRNNRLNGMLCNAAPEKPMHLVNESEGLPRSRDQPLA